MSHDLPKVLMSLNLGGFSFEITHVIFWLTVSSGLLIAFFWAATYRLKVRPRRLQNILELALEFIDTQLLKTTGLSKDWLPFIMVLFFYILFSNWIGLLPGADTASRNINFTGALAIVVFVVATIMRFKKHGLKKYLHSLVPAGISGPMLIVLLPIEIVGQLVKPFSLAIRLFANVTAGHLIIATLLGLIILFKNPVATSLSVAGASAIILFDIFIGLIQAYIFSFLSAMLIGDALSTEH